MCIKLFPLCRNVVRFTNSTLNIFNILALSVYTITCFLFSSMMMSSSGSKLSYAFFIIRIKSI